MDKKGVNKVRGIVLTCFNRPKELKVTLDCLERTLRHDNHIVVIDDASTDLEVGGLIRDFTPLGTIDWYENEKNQGIAKNLIRGFEILKKYGFGIMMNLDSDVELKEDWLIKITDLLDRYPDRIVTGFNANNTTRLPVVAEHEDYYEKQYIGGLNIAFKLCNYEKVLLSLQPDEVWQKGNAWDWHLCDIMKKEGKTFLVTKPGVINHIGYNSTLGHKGGDVDLNFKK